MKNRSLIDKTMHFLFHNSFLFTVAVMCLVHATLLVVMFRSPIIFALRSEKVH